MLPLSSLLALPLDSFVGSSFGIETLFISYNLFSLFFLEDFDFEIQQYATLPLA
jgi:hypothetical protein